VGTKRRFFCFTLLPVGIGNPKIQVYCSSIGFHLFSFVDILVLHSLFCIREAWSVTVTIEESCQLANISSRGGLREGEGPGTV
jgi:hypothetical protein